MGRLPSSRFCPRPTRRTWSSLSSRSASFCRSCLDFAQPQPSAAVASTSESGLAPVFEMRSLGLALFTCLVLGACSTQRQTVGTAGGVAAGAVVAGPVGAVVGGAVGAVATAPGYCYYRNRWGRQRRGRC